MQIFSVILSYLAILLWFYGIYLAFFSSLRRFFMQAAQVMWKRKYLWLLAFFAGLTAYGGEVNFFFRRLNTVTSLQGFLDGIRNAITSGRVDVFVDSTKNLWANHFGSMLGIIVTAVLITGVITWLIIMSQAAIVRIVGRSQMGKPTGLTDGLAASTEKFWTLVQLNIIGLLIGWALWVVLTAVPAAISLITQNPNWSFTAYLGSLASIASSVVTIFLIQFATADIVLHDTKLMPAIVDAWHLFSRNIVSTLEMAVAIFTVNLTLSYLIVAQLFFFLSAYTLAGFLTIVALIILLYTLLSAFSFSAWTIYYLKLAEGKTASKLGQWTNKLASFGGQKRSIQ